MGKIQGKNSEGPRCTEDIQQEAPWRTEGRIVFGKPRFDPPPGVFANKFSKTRSRSKYFEGSPLGEPMTGVRAERGGRFWENR